MSHGKLVRDRIPEIIGTTGAEVEVRKLEGNELLDALLAKLEEESAELRAANETDRREELADVLEVVHALATYWGIDLQDVQKTASAKRAERGGFDGGLWVAFPRPEHGQRTVPDA